jgi:hypothetical protein
MSSTTRIVRLCLAVRFHRTHAKKPDNTYVLCMDGFRDETSVTASGYRNTTVVATGCANFEHGTARTKQAKRVICQMPPFPSTKSGAKRTAAKKAARVHSHSTIWQLLASVRACQQNGKFYFMHF